MFYQNSAEVLSDNDTHLDPTQIFSGQFWDEFSLVGALAKPQAKVLLLGLSLGGGVRPILSHNKDLDLLAVDMDAVITESCTKYFRKNFSKLNFRVEIQEALQFLQSTKEKFDIVYVDLYSQTSYCEHFIDPHFYQLIASVLNTDGMLMANLYGLPNHFFPLHSDGIQSRVHSIVKSFFTRVRYFPYRRNLTLVASQCQIKQIQSNPHASLTNFDRTAMELTNLRLQDIDAPHPLFSNSDSKKNASTGVFSEIDQQMRNHWQNFVFQLKGYELDLTTPLDLLNLIQQPKKGGLFLNEALTRQDSKILFVPILAAGESWNQPLKLEWILDWFFQNAEELSAWDGFFYRQIWMTQIASLIVRNGSLYTSHHSSFLKLLKRGSQ